MKKYICLILSVIALVLNFLSFWYSDVLFNRFFIFGIIPLAFSLSVLLSALIASVICIFKDRSKIINCLAFVISIISVLILVLFPFRTSKVMLELHVYENERLEVIEMVKNNELVTYLAGNAELPKGYGKLSSDGEIYIYQNDEEQLVSFWVFRGILSGSVQLMYSSKDESLIYKNETGHEIKSIQKLKEHWYLVDTDY